MAVSIAVRLHDGSDFSMAEGSRADDAAANEKNEAIAFQDHARIRITTPGAMWCQVPSIPLTKVDHMPGMVPTSGPCRRYFVTLVCVPRRVLL